MNVEWPTILALIFSLLLVVYTVYRDRSRVPVMTREQQLVGKVAALEATVQTLLDVQTASQVQVNELQKELDLTRKELAKSNERIAFLTSELAKTNKPVQVINKGTLLVVVGEDPALQIDLAVLRKVERKTGITISRLSPVSMASLDRTLSTARKTGNPIKWIHASVHASSAGLVFSDGIASGQWLSEHLRNVEVLLISGCEGAIPATWAGVAAAVISMREEISHEDASDFAEVFWQAIGEGLAVNASFERALSWGPSNVSEFAELHV